MTSALQLRQDLLAKKTSAQEIAGRCLDRVAAVDGRVKAFLSVQKDAALAQAKAVDERLAKGEPVGPLAGIPIAVKDNICTTDGPTTCGSRILEKFVAPYDATVVARLRRAGAVILGKTNLDEFAMGSSTENSAFFTTRNPWNLELVPGGSSGGSAAAVAAGMAPLSLGSDTGGSIRQPAALTGTVGFKPTYGRVSRYGLVAYGSSLDQIGPFARTVEDAALLTQVISGHDPMDSTSIAEPSVQAVGDLDRDVRGLRLGVPKEYFGDGLDPEVRQSVESAIQALVAKGAVRVDVSLPLTEYAIAAYYIVAPCEASSNLARYDGVHYGHRTAGAADLPSLNARSRHEGFGPEVTRRIILGTFALSTGYYEAYYNRALKVRRKIRQDFDRAFEVCDVIVGPTSPTPAFPVGAKASDPLAMYLCDVYTVATNLAGLPGISIPCGLTKATLPIGLQIQGRVLDDLGVLRAARLFERELALELPWPSLA
ncbi:MAG TPA: Asp-tRNA(Asn)/Glu-tRNA(Gln) amidotransferase subunit GatA [Planctomycetota bacterium]|nr:Asp-tRNA(Asn)/Glu-tRNA(Gln) amidotransferase subunit GatA [Planctomycetota bacterium]